LKVDLLGRIIGDEIPLWENSDPHSRAMSSLDPTENLIAKQMMEKGKKWAPFNSSAACLSCHTLASNLKANQVDTGWKEPLRDAVSCESCHGPAKDWNTPHAKVGWAAEIRAKNAAPKNAAAAFLLVGLKDTSYLATRAIGCVECHLQIDKDLLDAGHPPLVFEMYWYNAYFRKDGKPGYKQHWDDRLKDGPQMLNARLWAVGQAAGHRAAIDQVKAWETKGWGTEDVAGLATIYAQGLAIAKKRFGTDDIDELSVVNFKLSDVQGAAADLAALAAKAKTIEQRRVVGYGVLALSRAVWEDRNPTKKPGEIWKDLPDLLKGYQALVKAVVLEKGGAEYENLLKTMAEKVQ